MKKLIEFTIPFRGLKDGIHEYDFKIDKKFFEFFEYSELDNVDLDVHLKMDKQATLMVLDFSLTGEIQTICDRCLDELKLPVSYQDRVVVKYGTEIPDEVYIGEEAQMVSWDDTEINVSQYIYEFAILSFPPRKVHPTDKKGKSKCNPEMLKQLGEYVKNTEEDGDIDPRWNELKKLLNDNRN